MATKKPRELEPCLAEIQSINDLGTSVHAEVIYHDGNDWKSYAGSTTFDNGETVLRWMYVQEAFVLKTCRDHWKSSYYAIYKTIGTLLEFYTRWKGVNQGWNQAMRTTRNREAYKLVKEIAEKRNSNNQPL